MRTAFFGTPEIAVPALRALAATTDVVGVVCQPDRPSGRGLALTPPAVKLAARDLGLEVHQPVKVKTGNLDEWLRERRADLAVVMAYGRILPAAVLTAPRLGCVNLHASILPAYRGAAPIQWAVIRGDVETGISLMQMDEGMDTGPVFSIHRVAIGPRDTAGDVAERLAELAAEVVRADLPRIVSGELGARPQPPVGASTAPPIERHHALMDWAHSATELSNLVRGMSPRPTAHTTLRGRRLRVHRAEPCDASGGAPGEVVGAGPGGIVVACGRGHLAVLRAQVEGRRPLDAADLINGRAVGVGDVLGGS